MGKTYRMGDRDLYINEREVNFPINTQSFLIKEHTLLVEKPVLCTGKIKFRYKVYQLSSK